MTDLDLAAEMKALRESIERLRKAIEYLTALKAFEDLAVRLRAEEPPQDMAAAGFERYRARLKAREART